MHFFLDFCEQMCQPSFLPYAKEKKNNSLKTDACPDTHAKLFLQIRDLAIWSEKFKIYFMSHMGLQRKFPMILQPRGKKFYHFLLRLPILGQEGGKESQIKNYPVPT